jgi:hypothetical protein
MTPHPLTCNHIWVWRQTKDNGTQLHVSRDMPYFFRRTRQGTGSVASRSEYALRHIIDPATGHPRWHKDPEKIPVAAISPPSEDRSRSTAAEPATDQKKLNKQKGKKVK